jgi:hypothetical protein
MIRQVPITQAMLSIIRQSSHRGVLNNNTLVGGEGNFAGRTGEIIVQTYLKTLKPSSSGDDRKGWDFIDSKGLRYDVKTKGNAKVAPQPHFDCTVPEYQLSLDCDAYIFIRTAHDFAVGYIMGYILKKDFIRLAEVRREGSNYNKAGRSTVGNHLVLSANKLLSTENL